MMESLPFPASRFANNASWRNVNMVRQAPWPGYERLSVDSDFPGPNAGPRPAVPGSGTGILRKFFLNARGYCIHVSRSTGSAADARRETAMSQEPPEKMMFQLTLRRRGISDQAVLRTMEEVPREVFVDGRRSRLRLPRQRARHRLRADHQPALRGRLHDRAAAAAKGAPGARDRHRLRLSGRGPVAALPAGADHRALPDAGRQRPRPARKARLSQYRGDARRRLRHSGRRRRFRPHHRDRGDGADPGKAAGSGSSRAAS